MQKRGQITVFIIIGIIIIAVFGFVYWVGAEVTRIKLETQVNRIVDALLATTPLNYYVTLCVDEAAKNGLKLIGEHGGYISNDEMDSLSVKRTSFDYCLDPYGAELTGCGNKITYNTSYGIVNDTIIENQYPCYTQDTNYNMQPAFCGFSNDINLFQNLYQTKRRFGEITFEAMPLCKPGECLADSIFIEKDLSGNKMDVPGQSINGEGSIQERLEAFIKDDVIKCVDFESIPGIEAFNITYDPENISVNTTLGANGIDILVNFPLSIKVQEFEPVIRILQFSTFNPARLKKIYQFARYIAEAETRILEFDLNYNWTAVPEDYKFPSFEVEIINLSNGDRVLRAIDKDTAHYLRGGPFVFQYAIQNRPPALDYIGTRFRADNLYDLIVVEGDIIKIEPKATDPDEENLSYNYSDWKETYDEEFDENRGGCTRKDPVPCIERINEGPHNWTSSDEYLVSERNASYKTNHTDIGPHQTTVCVFDNHENKDCQTVRILVDDVFEVIPSPLYFYDDIKANDIASIEDPIKLNATIIDYFNPGYTTFIWSYLPTIIYEGIKDEIVLPRDYPNDSSNYDLARIKDYWSGILVETGAKNLTVVVNRGGTTATEDTEIKLYQCLPHRSSSAPFPFHNIAFDSYTPDISDAFLANHTCCEGNPLSEEELPPNEPGSSGWGSYKAEGTECYNYVEYGCFNTIFTDMAAEARKNYADYPDLTQENKLEQYTENDIYNLTNDIIVRTFIGTCSGNRGNACEGNPKELKTNIKCADPAPTSTETERCFGPPSCGSPFTENPGCQPVPLGKTFEELNNLLNKEGEPATGICNPLKKCTDFNESATGYSVIGSGSRFFCNATCSGTLNGCSATNGIETCIDCWQRALFACTDNDAGSSGIFPGTGPFEIKGRVDAPDASCQESIGCPADFGDIKTYDDSCKDEKILIEYSCPAEPSAIPYIEQEINCNYLDEEAIVVYDSIDQDGNLIMGSCTAKKRGKCDTGKCEKTAIETESIFNHYQFENNEIKYNQSFAIDLNGPDLFGNVINESCSSTLIGLDSDATYCRSTNVAGQLKYLGWSSGGWDGRSDNKCCGNNANEIYNQTTNTCTFT